MANADLSSVANNVVRTIEKVGQQVEHVFAEVGGRLGTAHEMFAELNFGLDALSDELSGSKIESASNTFQDIANTLQRLAKVLPIETGLLGTIGASAAQASVLLKHLIGHIGLITVIARSSRIEAASLQGNRDGFLSFTKEASDLAAAVQSSIIICSREQEQLADAITVALNSQLAFERRYGARLMSVSAELLSTFSDIRHLQSQGVEIAKLAKAGTEQIGEAVGAAIVALQAGDSTRQRLEHICSGLRKVTDRRAVGSVAPMICRLQADQLTATVSEFETDIGMVNRSLMRLVGDAMAIVGHGNSLYGGKNDDMTAFLTVMKQRLAEALVLIHGCAQAKVAVDASISALQQLLGKFRDAIYALDETVMDITLIGMNAALKASHLGDKGRAFVVIANELKTSADRISGAAKLLNPVLLSIGTSAERLTALRAAEEPLHAGDLEHSIGTAVGEIEGGNGRLLHLMDHLTRESVQFEGIMTGATSAMSDLGVQFAALPEMVGPFRDPTSGANVISAEDMHNTNGLFDELYGQYTMEVEREVHFRHSKLHGVRLPAVVSGDQNAGADDVVFF